MKSPPRSTRWLYFLFSQCRSNQLNSINRNSKPTNDNRCHPHHRCHCHFRLWRLFREWRRRWKLSRKLVTSPWKRWKRLFSSDSNSLCENSKDRAPLALRLQPCLHTKSEIYIHTYIYFVLFPINYYRCLY